MRITSISVKNYKSFDLTGQAIKFPTAHTALVGKNNAGKSNILEAMNIVLGNKNPNYTFLEESDYFDATHPIEIKVVIANFEDFDHDLLRSIPGLTRQQQGALSTKLSDGTTEISFLLRKNLNSAEIEDDESQNTYEIKLWGFQVHRKVEDVRKSIIKILRVPALRNYANELQASRWTPYGELMKDVLEGSTQYEEIKKLLGELNEKVNDAFSDQKASLLTNARVTSYVDDINFQITKENNPTELLRNLEIYIKEGSRDSLIDDVGTGTQNAVIMGIMELALKNKQAKMKLFCIEEPEAFIHPHGVRYLGSLIKSVTSDQNLQVLIASHSLSLTTSFEPRELVRVTKDGGKTVVKQNTLLTASHYRRFIHQDNVEMFFSDRVVFVEGPTEKHLFSRLDKLTKLDPANQNSENCNFDRVNVGIIRLDSVDSLPSYIEIADAFGIDYAAVVDKDYLGKCRRLCSQLGITYNASNLRQMVSDLKDNKVLVNTRGEIEDLFSDSDISAISGKSIPDIQSAKNANPAKTSKAFTSIFGTGKAEYAIKISGYYIENNLPHPLESLIRKLYRGTF